MIRKRKFYYKQSVVLVNTIIGPRPGIVIGHDFQDEFNDYIVYVPEFGQLILENIDIYGTIENE